jgi:hypothetical protein
VPEVVLVDAAFGCRGEGLGVVPHPVLEDLLDVPDIGDVNRRIVTTP